MTKESSGNAIPAGAASEIVAAGIPFSKLAGQGNDFIIVDDRNGLLEANQQCFARRVCERRRSVGADGVLVIEGSQTADFRLRIFNVDGSEADMCGNGARCAAVYVRRKRIASAVMTMETGAGSIEALVDGGYAAIRMASVRELQPPEMLPLEGREPALVYSIDSGVPHAVVFIGPDNGGLVFGRSLEDVPADIIHELGQALRCHPRWGAEGSNADFVEIIDSRSIYVRTWERGVEGETPACGTGAVASAFAARQAGYVTGDTIAVRMPGGLLSVIFREGGKSGIESWLAGEVEWSFDGSIPWKEKLE